MQTDKELLTLCGYLQEDRYPHGSQSVVIACAEDLRSPTAHHKSMFKLRRVAARLVTEFGIRVDNPVLDERVESKLEVLLSHGLKSPGTPCQGAKHGAQLSEKLLGHLGPLDEGRLE
eukprot:XP_001705740.1 Hypothetical protein GL50803_18465 [Giardia lamblia ATCC 50803]